MAAFHQSDAALSGECRYSFPRKESISDRRYLGVAGNLGRKSGGGSFEKRIPLGFGADWRTLCDPLADVKRDYYTILSEPDSFDRALQLIESDSILTTLIKKNLG